jgi:hypothetical protein
MRRCNVKSTGLEAGCIETPAQGNALNRLQLPARDNRVEVVPALRGHLPWKDGYQNRNTFAKTTANEGRTMPQPITPCSLVMHTRIVGERNLYGTGRAKQHRWNNENLQLVYLGKAA